MFLWREHNIGGRAVRLSVSGFHISAVETAVSDPAVCCCPEATAAGLQHERLLAMKTVPSGSSTMAASSERDAGAPACHPGKCDHELRSAASTSTVCSDTALPQPPMISVRPSRRQQTAGAAATPLASPSCGTIGDVGGNSGSARQEPSSSRPFVLHSKAYIEARVQTWDSNDRHACMP